MLYLCLCIIECYTNKFYIMNFITIKSLSHLCIHILINNKNMM